MTDNVSNGSYRRGQDPISFVLALISFRLVEIEQGTADFWFDLQVLGAIADPSRQIQLMLLEVKPRPGS